MSKDEAIEVLSDIMAENNLFGDEIEATRYHALSWAIAVMKNEKGTSPDEPKETDFCSFGGKESGIRCGRVRLKYHQYPKRLDGKSLTALTDILLNNA